MFGTDRIAGDRVLLANFDLMALTFFTSAILFRNSTKSVLLVIDILYVLLFSPD